MTMTSWKAMDRLTRGAAWGFAKEFARGVVGGWRSPRSKLAVVEALEQRQLMFAMSYVDPIGPVIPMAEARVNGTPVTITQGTGGYGVDHDPGDGVDLVSFKIVGPGEATVTPVLDGDGGPILAYDVKITGSTNQTSFLVQDPHGLAKLRTVSVTGSLQMFNAPRSDLVSSLTVIGGGVEYLYLDDIYTDKALLNEALEQPLVLIGTDPGIRAVNAVLGEVRNLEFRALGAVRSILAHGLAGERDEAGNASVMIDAQSLFRVQTSQGMAGSDISAADDIGYISSGMNMAETRIEAGGSVIQVSASRMQYSQVYAGMRAFSGNLPASVEDFENKASSIGSVHLWDSTLDGSGSTFNVSFFESVIAAWKVGVVNLQDVAPTSGEEYGIAANSIEMVSYLRPEAAYYGSEDVFLVPVTVTNLTRPDDPRLDTKVEGFELEIFTTDFTPPTYKETPVLRSVNGELDVTLTMASTQVSINGGQYTFTAETYNGGFPGPTLRVKPGDILKLTLVNNLTESTNLHTHGLHVSPLGNSDNVFIDLGPGETTQYVYQIPADHPEGLYWYHPHLHGLTDDQVVMGLSGLIIVQGDGATAPELVGLEEKYMSLRNVPLDPITHEINGNLGSNEQLFMVNNQLNPTLSIAPGETQIWNIGNIGNEGWYELALEGQQLQIIGIDGNPMTQVMKVDSFSLAPGNRISILVTGSERGTFKLKTLGFNQGFSQWPERELATLIVQGTARTPQSPITTMTPRNNYYEDLRNADLNQTLTERFSEDFDTGIQFRINGEVYKHDRIDVTAILNTVDEWVLENTSFEWHPFHIHVNAFQVISINGEAVDYGTLMDTVGIPPAYEDGEGHSLPGQVVIRTRYTDFVGEYVFHCHILFHEDHGMMANIQVVQPGYTGGHQHDTVVASAMVMLENEDNVKLTPVD
jgi:suppressor of ftsI